MSQKRVDIEITGSAEKFRKAADDVQKKLDQINDSINDIGENDSVDKFARTFKKIGSYADEIKDKFSGQDFFEDMVKDAEELAKYLKDSAAVSKDFADDMKKLENLNLYKLQDSFKNTLNDMKQMGEVNRDLVKEFGKLDGELAEAFGGSMANLIDKDMFVSLRKEFDKLEDVSEDALEDIMRLTTETEELNRVQFNHIMNEIEQLSKITRDLNKPLEDIRKLMDEIDGEGLGDVEKEFKDLEKISSNLAKTMNSISKATKDFDKEFGQAISNNEMSLQGLDDNLGDLVLVLAEIKKRTSDTFDRMDKLVKDVTENVEDTTKEFKDLNKEIEDVDVKQLEKLEDTVTDTEKKVEDLSEEFKDLDKEIEDIDEKPLEDLNESIRDLETHTEEVANEFKDLDKAIEDIDDTEIRELEESLSDIDNYIDDAANSMDELDKEIRDIDISQLRDIYEFIDNLNERITELINNYKELGRTADDTTNKLLGDLGDAGKIKIEGSSDKGSNTLKDSITEGLIEGTVAGKAMEHAMEGVTDSIEEMTDSLKEAGEEIRDISAKWNNIDQEYADNFNFADKDQIQYLKKYIEDIKKLEDEYAKLEEECSKLTEEQQQMIRSYLDGDKALDELDDSIKDLALSMNKVRMETEAFKEDNEHMARVLQNLDNIMADNVESYEKIRQKVIDFINSNKDAVVTNKYVAESFMNLHNSMKEVYADIKPLPDGMFEEVIKAAKETKGSFDLISTEQLMKQLERLNKSLADTTEKTKDFKQMNQEGWGIKQAANDITDSMKDIQSFADNMAASVEKVGDEFVFLGDRVKKANKEFDTDRINDYMEALNDYAKLIRDTGGQVSKSFAGEDGNLDPKKYLAYFEKFGKPLNQINAELQKNKTQILECIKAYKEYGATIKQQTKEELKAAKTALQEAEKKAETLRMQKAYASSVEETVKIEKELSEVYKEVTEAKERLAKAEEAYKKAAAEAKEIDKNRVQNAKDLIQAFNDQAEAARRLGSNIKDITKKDLSFDSSLGSLLDDIFPNDIPKKLSDFKEDFQAIFADLGNLDFGGAMDNFKNIVSGVLDMIPGKAKIAAAAIAAIGKAMKEVADIGVNQFYKGMDTIGNVLGSVADVAQNIGSEVRDAFENITGFDMDFSSLIELPIDFESQMAKVGAIAGATGKDFEELEKKARQLGSTTRYSATEVAQAMEYMGMAGWKNNEIMAGLSSVLSLATVAQMDLGQASDFVTDGLTALGMEAKDAAYMVDILAKASTSSNTTVDQMQRAFTNCAPVAGTLGINIKDLSLALGLMADKGVKGAKAGTALKNLMANLSAPTEKQLSYIRQFNLKGAQQKIVTGDLVGGIKEMQAALSKLSPQQKNAVITTIAGKEALSGVSALLNTTESDLANLEKELNNCNGAADEMAKNFDDTLKGALLGLSSAIQERVLQIFDKCKDSIKDVTKQFTEFFQIWNGFSTDNPGLTGLAGAMEYLEKVSQGWGEALTKGIEQAIGAINEFVNSATFDNLLQVGTNIINGIANGIRNAAENGTLQSAITTAIRKIGTWFSENLDTVVEVGKLIIDAITKGISDNQDLIGEVIEQVIDMQNTIDSTVAYEKARLFGENFISFFCKGAESKLNEWSATLGGFLNGLFGGSSSVYGSGFRISDSVTGAGQWYNTGMNAGNDYNKGISDSTKKNNVTNEVVNQMNKGKVNTDTAAAAIGQGISDNILKKLETMDAGALKELRQELEGLQKTTSTVAESMGKSFGLIRESSRTEIVGMANIFRNQFINMTNITRNQMINVSNIIRNQAINWANIIRNQITNSRNAFTSQMMSMASVARTQMVNISNIIRNQSVNWANIIRNQAKNARDNLTRQFMSMASVVRTQMNKCLSSVKSTMSQIAKQTNKSMNLKVNVNKTVTTKNAKASSTPSMASAFYAANTASAFSMGTYANTSTLSSRASSAISSGGSSSSYTGSNKDLLLEIPLVVDGREIARSSAKYINGELKAISKRNDRKRGIK